MADLEVEVIVGGEPVQLSETEPPARGEPQVTESPTAEQEEKEEGGEEGEKEEAGEGAGEESDSDEEAETEEQKTGDEPPAEPQAAGGVVKFVIF